MRHTGGSWPKGVGTRPAGGSTETSLGGLMTLWDVLRRADGMHGRARGLLAVALAGTLLLGACAPGTEPGQRASLAGAPTRDSEEPPADSVDPMPTDGSTPVGGGPWSHDVTTACASVVPDGLAEVAQTSDPSGGTSFWAGGARWAACDVLLDDEDGARTLVTSRRAAPAGFDEKSLALGTTVVPSDGGDPRRVRFAAAGLLPWPVGQISYTFPDGHTEQARFVQSEDGSGDTWWSVTYTATDGPLVDPTSSAADLDPVTISIVGAAAEAFRLPWEDAQRTE